MRITLVGADFEENLGVGLIAAAVAEAGHAVTVVPFNERAQLAQVARQALASRPDVVGLSMQFQHRAREFLELGARLRAEGFRGHLTCGGHFPTLAWREVLGEGVLDSVVLHEGERTIVELLAALSAGRPVDASIAGVAVRDGDGVPHRAAGRPLVELDELPLPLRYRPHTRHLGVPFIPILGSRGCWGACSFCSITSFYRDARAHGGGRTLRLRSPGSVAGEMALLWHRAGGPSLFCFHDENLLLPRPADTLERLRAIRAGLDAYGVGTIGLVGKCRPDTLTRELARELAALGVVRLYVGVENAAAAGSRHLNRRMELASIREALAACREAGIFVCYNLLLFEPEATLEDLRDNLAFVREHAAHPMNFCRAEAYYGTPLHRSLEARDALGGSYLGWSYRARDPRVETLFRVCAAAFRQRNFDPEGVANRSMGLGYSVKILERFHDDPRGRRADLAERADELTRGIVGDTAARLEEAMDLCSGVTAPADAASCDAIEREAGLLGLRIAAADATWHRRLDELYADLERFAAESAQASRRGARGATQGWPPRSLVELGRQLAVGASLVAASAGCNRSVVVDPVPQDMAVDSGPFYDSDPVPRDLAGDQGAPDLGRPDLSGDAFIVDPPPPDLAMSSDDGLVVDPLPPADFSLPGGPLLGRLEADGDGRGAGSPARLIDQWRETTPARVVRSADLPLPTPPSVRLWARREGDRVRVRILGEPAALGTRWEADGPLDLGGEDGDACREVAWRPLAPDSQLRVGVRARGGVAVMAVRAKEVWSG